MTTIMCSIPNPADATSLYRGIGPLQTLKRQLGLEIMLNPDITWHTLKAVDVAFFQRPALADKLQAIKLCKANKKKVWIDYDDNLHAIPLCNRRYQTYGHPEVQHNIATMVSLADIVTVTTPHLATAMEKLLKCFPSNGEYNLDPSKIRVVPNAYDPELMPSLMEERATRKNLVVWRGSDSHCKDLMLYTDYIAEVMKDDHNWTYEFIGEPFWWTIEQLKKVTQPNVIGVTGPMDPVGFFRYLQKQKAALVIVPLEDQGFNRSKSNIAWIESTAAGAVTLAPDWDEWKIPGIINYSCPEDFVAKMQGVLRGEFDTADLWTKSRDYIMEHLQLCRVNKLREGILRELEGRSS